MAQNLNTRHQVPWGADVDLLCFSHLRWDFVYQRPQHLLSRAAKQRRVFYFEEPIYCGSAAPSLELIPKTDQLMVAVPRLPSDLDEEQSDAAQRELVRRFIRGMNVRNFVLWCYTPMALGFCCDLEPIVTVYDCMDELSLFKGASTLLKTRERELLERADVVFTGGQSLYESKRELHPNVISFPSSIDVKHFSRARAEAPDPEDQRNIPHLRIGFYGVLDERLDVELLRGVAELRPDWHMVIIGPVAKIDPADLPQAPNIHYLGAKKYEELPPYLANWDVASILFARNDATRFISPTKTPEYLAAGRPVVSTSIRDVIRPYGELGLVQVADEPKEFVDAVERALAGATPEWLLQVDRFLSNQSWDRTWLEMSEVISGVISRRQQVLETAID